MYGLLGSDNIWPRYNYLNIWNLRVQKNRHIEKITLKVVQMKFLAMDITNQKLRFNILHQEIHKSSWDMNKTHNKIWPIYSFVEYCYNIPLLLITGFVIQGHIYIGFLMNKMQMLLSGLCVKKTVWKI